MPRIIGASIYSENFQGGDITEEEWRFMKAMEAYQRRWRRRYPSWREVLYVLDCLGYRKVADAVPVEVKGKYHQKVRETKISDPTWADTHWRSLCGSYGKAPFFRDLKERFEAFYRGEPSACISPGEAWLRSTVLPDRS